MDGARCFDTGDTNIFIYADDNGAGAKRDRAREALRPLIAERRAVVSTQVLQEYFVVATRKLGMTLEVARSRVEAMSELDVVLVRPALVLGGCARILSEDLNNGQMLAGVAIENPLKS